METGQDSAPEAAPSRWCVARGDLERFKDSVGQLVAEGIGQPAARPEAGLAQAFETYFPECGDYRDGAALHQQVPPSRWCVTRADLERFRDGVKQLVAQGMVSPTARDPFQASNELVGPNLYTTNEQVIKPVTARAGKSSWALMLHPQGLPCELFVTHCWKEGIFEFLDKVLNSWPSQARNAYCCMLSNPQNLNIGALIGSPRDSPFTHALRTSRFVLVVPNMECSIYSRMWCVYEAFLAYQEQKIILTATARARGVKRHALCVFLLFLFALNTIWITREAFEGHAETQEWINTEKILTILQATAYLLLLTSSFIVPGFCALGLICLSATFSGVNLGLQCIVMMKLGNGLHLLNLTPYSMAVEMFLTLGIGVSSVIGEAVRLKRLQKSKEARQLVKGYTGRLWDAQCSVVEDRERILAELRLFFGEVEEAIQVLLDQGMSTPTLREARARVGRLKHAGYVSTSTLVLALCSLFYLPMRHIGFVVEEHRRVHRAGVCEDCATNMGISELCVNCTLPFLRFPVWTSAFGFLEAVVWVVIFLALPKDKRGFALQAVVRIGVFMGGLIIITMVLVTQRSPGEDDWANCIVQLGLAPLTLMLSAAGPSLAARTPVVGPWIVRQVMKPLNFPSWRRKVSGSRALSPA